MAVTKKVFSTWGEYIAACRLTRQSFRAHELGWAGGLTVPQACDYSQRGATFEECRQAQTLLDKVDASFRDRDVSMWVPSVAGAYPIVPEYLMGMPENMRQRRAVESDIAPVKLIIEPAIKARISQSQIANRAAAMAALVMRMTEMRPTELYLCHASRVSGGNDAVVLVKMDTAPLSLNNIVGAFDVKSVRGMQLLYKSEVSLPNGNSDTLDFSFGYVGSDTRAARMRIELGLVEHDILIQAGHTPDAALMDSDPVQWVHNQLEKQRTLE